MKLKYLFLPFLLFLLTNCYKDDDNSSNDLIVGKWQLDKIILNGFAGQTETLYNPKDVIYKFYSNGTLEIISNISDINSETMNYSIELDCLTLNCNNNEQMYEFLFLNGNKNEFWIEENTLSFGTAYVDGPTFVLNHLQ